jgi:hypothetical protein
MVRGIFSLVDRFRAFSTIHLLGVRVDCCAGAHLPLSPWLSRSHEGVKVQGSSTSSKPSITRGLPPMTTCSKTSFSKASMPLLAIISYEMRSTYWKLSAFSTKVRTSKSGGIGSKDALGRAAGIVRATSYHPQSRMRCGVARAGNTSAAASWLQTAGIAESKLARAVAIVQGASVAAKGEPQSIRRRHGESYRDVDATEEPCSERRGSCHVLSGVSANAATFTFPTHSHQSG